MNAEPIDKIIHLIKTGEKEYIKLGYQLYKSQKLDHKFEDFEALYTGLYSY